MADKRSHNFGNGGVGVGNVFAIFQVAQVEYDRLKVAALKVKQVAAHVVSHALKLGPGGGVAVFCNANKGYNALGYILVG